MLESDDVLLIILFAMLLLLVRAQFALAVQGSEEYALYTHAVSKVFSCVGRLSGFAAGRVDMPAGKRYAVVFIEHGCDAGIRCVNCWPFCQS